MNTESAVFTNTYKPGKLLPKTGGEGITYLYLVAAGFLTGGAVIWLIRRREYA